MALTPEQNQVTTVARRNGWTLRPRAGYHVWSKDGRQVMLAYDKTSGKITSAYIDGVQYRNGSRLTAVLAELVR